MHARMLVRYLPCAVLPGLANGCSPLLLRLSYAPGKENFLKLKFRVFDYLTFFHNYFPSCYCLYCLYLVSDNEHCLLGQFQLILNEFFNAVLGLSVEVRGGLVEQ